MKIKFIGVMISVFISLLSIQGECAQEKLRIFIVSSYHPEYLWSQDTQKGVCAAFLDFKYLDNTEQVEELIRNNNIESTKVVIKKAWMDTKQKSTEHDIANATARIVNEINTFQPDLILLGDDNAANYIGNLYIDSEIPIVFWGINGLPLKYGLLESLEIPGHNVTGVYQAGYLKESIGFLKKLVPDIKTFAVISDDSETGRSKVKEIEQLHSAGQLELTLAKTIITNSFSEWKAQTLDAQKTVDAIFMLNHNTLKDDAGSPIDQLEAGAWYLRHVKKPDCAHEKQFAQEGVLLVVDDSGYKQGYEAVKIAHQILSEGKDPGKIAARAPERGPVIVNRHRAKFLELDISETNFIEEVIDSSLALEKYPE